MATKTFLDLPVDVVQLIALKTESTTDYLNIALVCKHFSGILSKTQEHPRRAKAIRYFTRLTISSKGTKIWVRNGVICRYDDKPAIIRANGTKEWYVHGKLHRDNDKPAKIYSDGSKWWYQNGLLHRDNDKPAIIWWDGSKSWYQHGKRYRENNKPAKVWSDGTKEWWVNEELVKTEY